MRRQRVTHARRVTKAKWYAAGAWANSLCWRRGQKNGSWAYYITWED